LDRLFITDNMVSDLSPLSKLVNLDMLGFGRNEITDISPLKNLSTLSRIEAHLNPFEDCTPISTLPKLTALTLDDRNGSKCEIQMAHLSDLNVYDYEKTYSQ